MEDKSLRALHHDGHMLLSSSEKVCFSMSDVGKPLQKKVIYLHVLNVGFQLVHHCEEQDSGLGGTKFILLGRIIVIGKPSAILLICTPSLFNSSNFQGFYFMSMSRQKSNAFKV